MLGVNINHIQVDGSSDKRTTQGPVTRTLGKLRETLLSAVTPRRINYHVTVAYILRALYPILFEAEDASWSGPVYRYHHIEMGQDTS